VVEVALVYYPPAAMSVRDRLKRTYYKVSLLCNRLRHQVQPADHETLLKMADAHVHRQEWPQVIGLLPSRFPAAADQAYADRLLAQAHHGQGDRAAAMMAIERSLVLDATSPWAYQCLGQIHLANEDFEAAITAFQQAVALDDQVSWLHCNLGEALVKHGCWQAAELVLQAGIRLNPLFAWAYYYLAEAQLAQGNWAGAKQAYQKAQLVGPDIEYLRGNVAYVEYLPVQAAQIQDYIQRVQAQDAQGPRLRPQVLLITPGPPYPPKSGVAVRMFHEMQALHAQADLVVASLLYDKNTFAVQRDLAAYSQLAVVADWNDRPSRLSDQSKTVHRHTSRGFAQILQQLSQVDFDIVVTDFVYMADYRALFPKAFHVLSEHNVESQILRRTAMIEQQQNPDRQGSAEMLREADRLAAFEDQTWPDFPLRWMVSEPDRQQLMQRCAVGETRLVNNGANTRSIQPLPDNPVPRVLLIGTLNYRPNIDGAIFFANEVLPHIWRMHDQVEFWIAGANPDAAVLALARRDPRIKVIANPDEMLDVAQQCCLAVVPLRIGSGTRIKILHALAMGLPTITTTLGCEGLRVEDDQHLLVRDQPEAFAAAVVGLIRDAAWRDRLRQNGRRLVEQQYDWEQIFQTAVTQLRDRAGWSRPERQ
jgi:glycosyltransferase involved in cell wall biosynthesis